MDLVVRGQEAGTVRRHELTDAQRQRSEPFLPGNGKPGGQWADHRKVTNPARALGVLFRARSGVPWPDLPERYGPCQTVYERHRRRSADGTWKAVLQEPRIEADAGAPDTAVARQEWPVNINSTSCRAHQHAAGRPAGPRPTTRKKGRRP
ncbi:transposase [Streptomyces prunicolor]|uniref:transposase n=1 Tax=Streptomyces prunicolor TaxID=67348 RepID=UPI0037132900